MIEIKAKVKLPFKNIKNVNFYGDAARRSMFI